MTTVVTEGVTVTEVAEAVVEDTVAAVVDAEVEAAQNNLAQMEEEVAKAKELVADATEEGGGQEEGATFANMIRNIGCMNTVFHHYGCAYVLSDYFF